MEKERISPPRLLPSIWLGVGAQSPHLPTQTACECTNHVYFLRWTTFLYSLIFMPVWEGCFSPTWKSPWEGRCCYQQVFPVVTDSHEARLQGNASSRNKTQTHYSWSRTYLSTFCGPGTVPDVETRLHTKTACFSPSVSFQSSGAEGIYQGDQTEGTLCCHREPRRNLSPGSRRWLSWDLQEWSTSVLKGHWAGRRWGSAGRGDRCPVAGIEGSVTRSRKGGKAREAEAEKARWIMIQETGELGGEGTGCMWDLCPYCKSPAWLGSFLSKGMVFFLKMALVALGKPARKCWGRMWGSGRGWLPASRWELVAAAGA